MPTARRRRLSLSGAAVALTLLAALGPGATAAGASGPPLLGPAWASSVFATTARLNAQITPNGLPSSYHFDYIAKAAYDANGETFAGAARSPAGADANITGTTKAATVQQLLSNLAPDTAYRYRVVAKNSDPASPTIGETHAFATQAVPGGTDACANAAARAQQGASFLLPDCRGWEMVSPPDKNGGEVSPPGALAGGGVLQTAALGGAVTYGSAASFAGGAGAPPASQYIATRNSGGWSSENITAPIFSATYDIQDEGVPYQLFSPDLARGLLLNGDHCRGEGEGCAVANPPLTGTDAPVGYQNYYLREGGGFTALLGAANIGFLALDPADFDLRLAGASPDLLHVVLSTCAALSANATEVSAGEGCDPEEQNLYEYSSGAGLSLLNLLPGETQGSPGAVLAASSGAVSENGARVYFSEEGDLYLREGATTKQVDEDLGGGGAFQTATPDGATAFYTKAGHLYRYEAPGSGQSADLTSSGGVAGVLGASENGDAVYYQDAAGIQLWHSPGTSTEVAPGADAAEEGDYPPATGTARVSADGTKLLFVSSAYALSGYDNTQVGEGTSCDREAPFEAGQLCTEVFLYDAAAPSPLTCVSCNPTNGRPEGPSSIPGSIPNGGAPGSTDAYKPRVLSADGRRVFFDSRDALTPTDTNKGEDVYQWEAQGKGTCARAGGCVALISSGRATGGASFVDASADGTDAFFLTAGSLIGADPGSVDLYDARAQGGFAVPAAPTACEADACQVLPPEPVDPTLTTLLSGKGNPPVSYAKHCKKGAVKRKGKCVKKGRRKRHVRHHRRSGR